MKDLSDGTADLGRDRDPHFFRDNTISTPNSWPLLFHSLSRWLEEHKWYFDIKELD